MQLNKSPDQRRGLIVPLTKGVDGSHPVYMISGLGGHVFSLQLIARAISEKWRFNGILHPVFIDNLVDTIEGSAELMAEDILKQQNTGPYFVGGYSMGGLIAIEIARILMRKGLDARLVLLDTRPPKMPPLKPLFKRLPIYLRWYGEKYIAKVFTGFKDDRKKKAIGTFEDHDAIKKVPPVFKLAFQIGRKSIEEYKPSACEVDTILVRSKITAWWDGLREWDEDYGWSNYLTIKKIVYCPGDHLDLIGADNYWRTTGEAIEHGLEILKT